MSDISMLFDVAFGHGKTKAIARGVGCSTRQAKRMLERRSIPAQLREAVLRLAHQQLDLQLAKIEAAKNVVQAVEFEETQEDRNRGEGIDGAVLAQRDRQADRSKVPSVMIPIKPANT